MKLLSAIADLLWLALAFLFVWLLRAQIVDILRRLSHVTKWKGLGQETELNELEKAAEKAEEATVVPQRLSPESTASGLEDEEEAHILSEAAKSPKAALLLLGVGIQKRLRQLLAAANWQQNIKSEPLSNAIDRLREQGSLSASLSGSLKLLIDVKNKLIHAGQATDDDIFRAIDSGLTILRAINSIPAETNTVYKTGIDLYSDATCKVPIFEAKGIMLEATSPSGSRKPFRIVPTTETKFQEGKRVAWEWNMSKQWGPAWYHDPVTREIEQAWIRSAEFTGHHLNDV